SRVAVARAYSSPRRVRVTSLRDAVARRLFAVMGLSGVEPLTSRLSGVRSNHLSYRPCCSSLPIPPRSFARPELLVLFVVKFVIQVVVFVEIVQILLVELVLIQLVVEVLVQVLVLFEVFELFVVETVAATLERPVRRLTGQHRHPQLRLRLMV